LITALAYFAGRLKFDCGRRELKPNYFTGTVRDDQSK
jgi:hypothetical protein